MMEHDTPEALPDPTCQRCGEPCTYCEYPYDENDSDDPECSCYVDEPPPPPTLAQRIGQRVDMLVSTFTFAWRTHPLLLVTVMVADVALLFLAGVGIATLLS